MRFEELAKPIENEKLDELLDLIEYHGQDPQFASVLSEEEDGSYRLVITHRNGDEFPCTNTSLSLLTLEYNGLMESLKLEFPS